MYPVTARELPEPIQTRAFKVGDVPSAVCIPQLDTLTVGTKLRIHTKKSKYCDIIVLTLRAPLLAFPCMRAPAQLVCYVPYNVLSRPPDHLRRFVRHQRVGDGDGVHPIGMFISRSNVQQVRRCMFLRH